MHFRIKRPNDYLYPHERLVEIIYGLVIALTITNAVRVIGGTSVINIELMVVTSLGAGTAWGIIDAILYLLIVVFQKNRYARIATRLRSNPDDTDVLATIQEDLEDSIVGTLDAEDQEAVYHQVMEAQRRSNNACYVCQPRTITIGREDLLGAFQIFFAMLLATLLVIVPLWLITPPHLAVIVSNIIAFTSLFMVGYIWARHTNIHRVLFGFVLVTVGACIVGIALLLGG